MDIRKIEIRPISVLLPKTHDGKKFVRPTRNVLDILSYAHVGGAILSSCLIFFVRAPDIHAWSVVVTVILLGMVLTRVVQWQLGAVFASAAIDATTGASDETSHGYWDRVIALAVLGATALALVGVLVLSWVWKDTIPLWPAVVAMTAAETIYLSWLFESVAIKKELDAIAQAFSKAEALDDKASLEASDDKASPGADDLVVRARLLIERLLPFGFRIVTAEGSVPPAVSGTPG